MAAARKAQPAWQALSGHERARYLYALARQVQKHSRRLAVLETMDNGKPIRESRDIDIPLVARHFYHHAGWAQLLEQEFPQYTACGVVGQVIPWNFPLLMFAWKVAPALAAGNTVVIKPAKYTPLTALAFAELAMEAGLAAGRAERADLRCEDRAGADRASGDRQGCVYRIDGGGAHHSQGNGELARKSSRSSWAASRRSWFSTMPISTRRSKGLWTRSGSTRGRCAARDRGCWCRSAWPRRSTPKCARAWRRCAWDRRWTRRSTLGRLFRRCSWRSIRKMVDAGVAEGAKCWQPKNALPEKGSFYPPTLLTDVHPAATVVQEEIFGPVLVAHDLPHAGRGRGAGEQHGVWAGRERLEREHQRGAGPGVAGEGGRGVGELAPTSSTRRAGSAAIANRATGAKADARACWNT